MLERTRAKLAAGEQITLVALGDSNTEVTFHTRGHQNWVGLLQEALFEAYGNGACLLINAGKCASNCRDALERLERDVLRFSPDAVIIALGMNDAGGGADNLEQFRALLGELVATIRARCGSEILLATPNPVVTVHGLPLPSEQPAPGKAWNPARRPLELYAAAIVALGQELDCAVVDHYTAWTARHFHVKHPVADPTGLWPRMSDAIHPGPLGHRALFRELAPHFGVAKYFPWEEIEED